VGSEGRVETNARSESEGQGHRVPTFDLFDPAKDYGKFFLTDAEYAALIKAREEARYLPTPYHSPDEPVNAISLSRRIRALADAMQNIDRYAIRLARWKARHMPNGTKAGTVGLKHTSLRSLSRCQPMRIGQPPGWKKHPETAIEEVVKDTHILALDAWDTS
jgi:hypothetical protein